MGSKLTYALIVVFLVLLVTTTCVLHAATTSHSPYQHNTNARFHDFQERLPPPRGDAVWATSCNSNYVQGVLKLNKSMRNVGSRYPLVCFCFDSVSESQEKDLREANIRTVRLPLSSIFNPYKPKWTESFGKLECWRLPHAKVCWIDSDMIQLQNCDELLDVPLPPHGIACAVDHEIFPKASSLAAFNMFQSGLFVLTPAPETYTMLHKKLGVLPSADGGDQGFLTSFYAELAFRPVVFLSSAYNYGKRGYHRHSEFDLQKVKVLHFVGHPKPWKGGENGYEALQKIWERT